LLRNKLKIIAAIGFISLVFYLYKYYEPGKATFFPPCPFYFLTGLKCAGCGSQRALHSLLNFNLSQAIYYNVFLVFCAPYLIVASFSEYCKHTSNQMLKLRNLLVGEIAVKFFFVLILIFWISRNFFPEGWWLQ